jgi:hypothetical protein
VDATVTDPGMAGEFKAAEFKARMETTGSSPMGPKVIGSELSDPDDMESEKHPPVRPNPLPDEQRVDEKLEEGARARKDPDKESSVGSVSSIGSVGNRVGDVRSGVGSDVTSLSYGKYLEERSSMGGVNGVSGTRCGVASSRNGIGSARSSTGDSSSVMSLSCGKDWDAANPSATRLDTTNPDTTDPDATEPEEHLSARPDPWPGEDKHDGEVRV